MHILTWNINGLRAVLTKAEKSLDDFLDACEADIICFQETKLTRSEMTEPLACPARYDAFYAFSRTKKGYSGVATFVRTASMKTLAAETDLCAFQEGRLVVTVHPQCVLLNVYCPAKACDMERKMQFHDFLTPEIARWRGLHPDKPIIIAGDLNVIHREIDVCIDFLPNEATEWLDELLADEKQPLRDAFRHFHPTEENAYTCWHTLTGARETNYGVRLDYFLVDPALPALDCWLWPSKQGSDHCPVVLRLQSSDRDERGTPTTVPACAKFFPEFAGTQQTIHMFLQRRGQAPPSPPSAPPLSRLAKPPRRQQSIASFFGKQTNSVKTMPQAIPTPTTTAPMTTVESIHQVPEFQSVAASWKTLLTAPTAPLCAGHQLPCLLRTVLKQNENFGRKFYLCPKPEGAAGDPKASCNHFEWVASKKRKVDSPYL
ncbi:Aste57867_18154 [Aphanomyces stellatus]|uniref:DNA-(apurinic or apyrimidinic site) endonuclease n=1 Tax=Aphanomyces stellatus TaxID=120398 RepID=A0A485L9P4_9STRA|nr:hypothetical protein As57867_018092 [Aphanomyces stellatus]VFT94892.1 Aste57867_18154 [Aphanomyces stellatus]